MAHQQSNSGKDIVTHIEYDAFGRQTRDYLPFVADGAASLCRLMLNGQWIGGAHGPKSLRTSAHYLASVASANDKLTRLVARI